MKKSGIIITVIGGISIMVAALILGLSFYNTRGPAKTISVVGLAEKDFVSDLIVWNMSISLTNTNLKEGYSEIKKQTEMLRNYLLEKGIPANEMVFNAIDTYEDYNYDWDSKSGRNIRTFNGYQLTQSVRVESEDVEKIEKIARSVSELLDQGIHISAYSPEYYYTKLSDLKIEMLATASKDARFRAETIAENAGASLGKLKTANMGVFQITAPNTASESYTWGGAFNTSSKNKRASINMRLTYFVN